jgi:hypothetical protein
MTTDVDEVGEAVEEEVEEGVRLLILKKILRRWILQTGRRGIRMLKKILEKGRLQRLMAKDFVSQHVQLLEGTAPSATATSPHKRTREEENEEKKGRW